MLRRQYIIDRHDANGTATAERARNAVMGVQAAGNQAAAVKIHETGKDAGARGRIEPDSQFAARTRQRSILHPFKRHGWAREFHQRDEPRAAFIDRGAARVGWITRGEEIQEALDAWVERHPRPNYLTGPMPAESPPATF